MLSLVQYYGVNKVVGVSSKECDLLKIDEVNLLMKNYEPKERLQKSPNCGFRVLNSDETN